MSMINCLIKSTSIYIFMLAITFGCSDGKPRPADAAKSKTCQEDDHKCKAALSGDNDDIKVEFDAYNQDDLNDLFALLKDAKASPNISEFFKKFSREKLIKIIKSIHYFFPQTKRRMGANLTTNNSGIESAQELLGYVISELAEREKDSCKKVVEANNGAVPISFIASLEDEVEAVVFGLACSRVSNSGVYSVTSYYAYVRSALIVDKSPLGLAIELSNLNSSDFEKWVKENLECLDSTEKLNYLIAILKDSLSSANSLMCSNKTFDSIYSVNHYPKSIGTPIKNAINHQCASLAKLEQWALLEIAKMKPLPEGVTSPTLVDNSNS